MKVVRTVHLSIGAWAAAAINVSRQNPRTAVQLMKNKLDGLGRGEHLCSGLCSRDSRVTDDTIISRGQTVSC